MGSSAGGFPSSRALLMAAACCLLSSLCNGGRPEYISAVGDPGMRKDCLRVAFEAWNFCNEVGAEAPAMGSPRLADCFDLDNEGNVVHKVTEKDNKLGFGDPIPGTSTPDVDLYAVAKELYLGKKCEVDGDDTEPWQFWMLMVKNGILDTSAGLCPDNGKTDLAKRGERAALLTRRKTAERCPATEQERGIIVAAKIEGEGNLKIG